MSEINFKDKQDYIDYLTGRSRFADGGQVAPTDPSTPVNPTPNSNPMAIPSPNPSITQPVQQPTQPQPWVQSQGASPTPQAEQPGFKLPTTPNPGNATWDYHQGQWVPN